MTPEPRQAALAYAERGWQVFPCHSINPKGFCTCKVGPKCEHPGKHPLVAGGFKAATVFKGEIKAWYDRWPWANVGIACGKASGLVVLDIDPRNGGHPEKLPGNLPIRTCIVRTGSGGWHYYLAYPESQPPPCMTGLFPGVDLKSDGGYIIAPPSRHASGNPYFFQVPPGQLALMPGWLTEAIQARGQASTSERSFKNSSASSRGGVPFCPESFAKGQRDNTLYTVARTLYRGGMAPQEAEQLIKILANYCDPPFPEQEAIRKVASAFKEARNLAQEIRDLISGTSGGLRVTEVDKILGIGTNRDKENRKKIFQRLVAEGRLEKTGAGLYRVVQAESAGIDFLNADTGGPLPVKWPFGIEQLVNIYKKNIVIVAGSKDSGKTAFMLNVARLNQDDFNVAYFSSEMGAEEMRLRVDKFDYPISSWNFNAYERASNFSDAIIPDAFNIIDFLEISDSFYLIAGELRKIHDKLKDGVACIAIQKDERAPLGRGASFSLEKARFYLTLTRNPEYHEAKIVSGKNWAQPGVNPAGKTFRYKLAGGCKFIEAT